MLFPNIVNVSFCSDIEILNMITDKLKKLLIQKFNLESFHFFLNCIFVSLLLLEVGSLFLANVQSFRTSLLRSLSTMYKLSVMNKLLTL